MTRRRTALLCLLAGALLAALVPWTVRSDQVVATLARQIKESYGIVLSSNGSLTLTLLPLPQLTLSQVALASADGMAEAEAEELRMQLRPLPLLRGRLRLYKVWLARSRVAITLAEAPSPSLAGTLARLRERIGTAPDSRWVPRIDRFLLTEGEIAIRDRSGRDLAQVRQASLFLSSPEPEGEIGLTASGEWNGESAVASLSGLDLAAIREGRPQEVEADVAGRLGRLTLAGQLVWSGAPRFEGAIRGRATSLGALARWSGLAADLADIDRPGSVSGDGTIDLGAIQIPRVSIEIGNQRLDGTVAMQLAPKAQLRATLAGDDLDLGWLGRILDPAGSDRLNADYDVRLSASTLALGPLRLGDAAVSVQSTARAVEVSLGRASFAGGALRGRVSAVLDGEGREIRALAWADGIDLAQILPDLAGIRGLSGTASCQLALDVTGDRSANPVPQMRGRGTVRIRDGEFVASTLGEAAKRAGHGAVPADWRTGRMRFGEARASIEFGHGQAELREAVVEAAGTRSQLSGRIDLRSMDASLRLSTPAPASGTAPASGPAARPPLVLDLAGPLRRLSVSVEAATSRPPAAAP